MGFTYATDHDQAAMSEGLCPVCSSHLRPPARMGKYTLFSGVCSTHCWWIIRRPICDEVGPVMIFNVKV